VVAVVVEDITNLVAVEVEDFTVDVAVVVEDITDIIPVLVNALEKWSRWWCRQLQRV
jgi:hypothetical protein